MTDNEIIKALEHEIHIANDIGGVHSMMIPIEPIKCALDLINRQQAEIEKQQYILMGVMHSVDKWLDGDELKQDEVNRATTMREKTLQITEKQSAEIEKLNVELVGMRGACESYKMHYDNAQAEIERLKALVDEMSDYFPACIDCEGKTTLGERTDECVYLIGNTEYCAKKGIENIGRIMRENRELKEMTEGCEK